VFASSPTLPPAQKVVELLAEIVGVAGNAFIVNAVDAPAPPLPLKDGPVDPIEILYPEPCEVPAGIVIVPVTPVFVQLLPVQNV